MAIPDPIKTNFHTLSKAFEKGDIALLECRDRNTGEPAYAICAINIRRQVECEPEIEMVPIGLMSVPAMINVSIHASPQRQGEPVDELSLAKRQQVSIHASPQRQGERLAMQMCVR